MQFSTTLTAYSQSYKAKTQKAFAEIVVKIAFLNATGTTADVVFREMRLILDKHMQAAFFTIETFVTPRGTTAVVLTSLSTCGVVLYAEGV